MIEGAQTYIDYIGIKSHFNQPNFFWNKDYTYKKINEQNLRKRKDYRFFQRLEELCVDRQDVIDHLISYFVYNNDFWIGQFADFEYLEFHSRRMDLLDSLDVVFKKEMENLELVVSDYCIRFDELLVIQPTKDPLLLNYMPILSFETIIIIDYFSGFTDIWFPINPLQKQRRMLFNKYGYLLDIKNNRHYEKFKKTYQSIARSAKIKG